MIKIASLSSMTIVVNGNIGNISSRLRDHNNNKVAISFRLPSKLFSAIVCHRWVQIALYQLCFTIVLSLYTGLLLYGYLSTLDYFKPRLIQAHRNQALSFRPLPQHPRSTLINFKHGSNGNWHDFQVIHKRALMCCLNARFPGEHCFTGALKCCLNARIPGEPWLTGALRYLQGALSLTDKVNNQLTFLQASLTDFVRPYAGYGTFLGPSEKCTWTTKLDKYTRFMTYLIDSSYKWPKLSVITTPKNVRQGDQNHLVNISQVFF